MNKKTYVVAACLAGVLGSCGDDGDTAKTVDSGTKGADGTDSGSTAIDDDGDVSVPSLDDDASADRDAAGDSAVEPPKSELFALSTAVFGTDTNGYVKLVESIALGGAALEVDKTWTQYSGLADMWVQAGFVYIASGDTPVVTKYNVGNDGKLKSVGQVSFVDYGVVSSAFWNNTFVSETKAYMGNGVTEMVIWNPTTMEIEGTVSLPKLEKRGALVPRVGLADRSSLVKDGKVYQTIYWADDTYAERSDDSIVVVIDTATDAVVDQLSIACPGLDYATIDDDGNLYFSNWTGGVGTYYVLKTAQNCVGRVDGGTGAITTIPFADIADGHEGAAFKYVGDGTFVMSVFDEVKADAAHATDFRDVVAGLTWQVWSYSPSDGKSAVVPAIDWNSGAVVHTVVDGDHYALVPGAGYATTDVYRLDGEDGTEKVYAVNGWSFRIFGVR